MKLTAATYNVHGCVGTDGRYAPERVAEVLRTLDAGIIGLQEVDNRRPRIDGAHQFDYLRHSTGMNAVAGPNIANDRGEYGNALLTSWPVACVRRHDLSWPKREPRGALDVDLETQAGPLRVVVTHLGHGYAERRWQVARLRAALTPLDDRPTLLMGDFNDWLPHRASHLPAVCRVFAAEFRRRTYPAWAPFLALDRIYAHPGPVRADARAHRRAPARRASDHLPLRLVVEWPEMRNRGPIQPLGVETEAQSPTS